MQPFVRIAAEDDVPRITEIIVGAFRLDELPEKRRRQSELIRTGFRDFLVLEDEGRVAGTRFTRVEMGIRRRFVRRHIERLSR